MALAIGGEEGSLMRRGVETYDRDRLGAQGESVRSRFLRVRTMLDAVALIRDAIVQFDSLTTHEQHERASRIEAKQAGQSRDRALDGIERLRSSRQIGRAPGSNVRVG